MKVIDSFRGEYQFLSNFYPHPVEFDGLVYPTSEAAFQAQKCTDPADREKYTRCKNPVMAKRMGRREVLPPDWETACYAAMEAILRVKFSDPDLAARLIATGDAYLEEGNHWHDNRWGRCRCEACRDKVAENRLGRMLMEIRADLARADA
jgi:ribA/ribD-fused uncharacterized protein